MAMSILSNIPSLVAQNQLAVTNNNLEKVLFQLSSGSKINSGADDPAGLSIANGLQANISALTQSAQNVTDGVGQLQVADGALSQVTTLLNRAVTLATEAANGGLTPAQFGAVNTEYNSILSEITRIGNATNFNGTSVFQAASVASPNSVASTATSNVTANTALTATDTTTVALGTGAAYTFTPGTAASTLYTGAQAVSAATTIANGATLSVGNTGGTFNFTANSLNYTGATGALTAATVLTAGNATLSVTNASGTVTYAGGPVDVGDWLNAFNAAGASKGISANLNGGHLVITSNSGITAVAAGTEITAVMGALTAGTNTEELTGVTTTTNGTATTLNDNITLVSGGNTATYNGGAVSTVGAWITGFNTNASVIAAGLTASLNAGGFLQIQGTAPITSVNASAANVTDFGALGVTQTASPDTVGDLMTQINNSGFGLTASIDGNNHLNLNSSNGNILISNNTTQAQVGALTATSTVQNLINGINSSGLGLTAGLAAQTNQLVGPTTVTNATVVTAGSAMTLTSTPTTGSAKVYAYSTTGASTVGAMITAINNSGEGFTASLVGAAGAQKLQIVDNNLNGNIAESAVTNLNGIVGALANPTELVITDTQNRGDLAVTNTDAALGFVNTTNPDSFVAPTVLGSGGASVFISDGQVSSLYNTIAVPVGLLSTSQIGGNTTTLGTQSLATAPGATAALGIINTAISSVASMRGVIGAGINRLNSATNVINTQVQNLTSAQSSIQDANIGQVVANMSKFQVLEQTGIAALAQSNSSEQAVLKLLQ
jgi:flagellin